MASFGTSNAWPGIVIEPSGGIPFDFSRHGRLSVAVSNTIATPQRLWMKLRLKDWPRLVTASSATIPPFAAGEISYGIDTCPWRLDAPLDIAVKNAPLGPDGRTNLTAVTEIQIFRKNGECPIDGSFVLLGATACAPGAGRPILNAAKFLPFVDEFGQFKHAEWQGKVHSAADLTDARDREEKWLSSNADVPGSGYDRFGGWSEGPQVAASGRFRTEKMGGKWWLVDPDGRLFFSFGIVGVRPGEPVRVSGREAWFEGFPPGVETFDYASSNLRRKYGADTGDYARAHRRMRAWGVNTIGNWSGRGLRAMRRTPYVADLATDGPPIAGAAGWSGKRFPDPFSAEFAGNIRRATAEEAKRSGGDAWCIGWFVDNELPWSNDNRYLARGVLSSPASQPAKKAARKLLKTRYADISALNAAWGTSYPDWDGFMAATSLPDGMRAGADLDAIQDLVARMYFKTVRDAVKAADPSVLYLGCRFSNGGASAWRAAAMYCDVVSVNAYRMVPAYRWPDDACDKPIVIGEFHFGVCERMFSPGLVRADSRAGRVSQMLVYMRAALDDPRIVGAHWFKWRDQSLVGRSGDGENYQIGFVDVCDAPYPEMVDGARKLAAEMYSRRAR